MPELGRFISEDPWPGLMAMPTSMNPYPYVVNNPLKYVDPLGLAPNWDGCPDGFENFIQDLIGYGKELEGNRPYVNDYSNWQEELYDNITPLIDLIPSNIEDEQRKIIIDAIIISEAQKLQAKYMTIYIGSGTLISKYITQRGVNKTLAPLYEEYPTVDKNVNPLVKALVGGLIDGLHIGTWYAAFTSNNQGATSANKIPTNPDEFNPEGLIRKDYKNGEIIKWHDPKTGKAIFEWNKDIKYGDHFHITPDGKNRFVNPNTGDTHLWPGDLIPKEFLDFFK